MLLPTSLLCVLFVASAAGAAVLGNKTEVPTGDGGIAADILNFSFGDSTYELSTLFLNWVESKRQCQQKGMDLVAIETLEEDLAIRSALAAHPSDYFWTSGNDIYQEGYFYWDSTGANIGPHVNWQPGQPDNGEGAANCIVLFANYWHDSVCFYPARFICEKKTTACEK